MSKGDEREKPAILWVIPFVVAVVLFFVLGGPDLLQSFDGDSRSQSASSGNVRTSQETQAQQTTLQTVTLLGENTCSDYVDLDAGPRGENYVEGPTNARIHWQDGTSGFITEWFGVKGGRVCFTGPAGETVTVRQVPNET